MSLADKIFVDMCKDILENGTSTEGEKVRPHWEDGTSAYTIKKFGVVNRYDLSKEFPAIKTCTEEMLWIWQRKSNNIHDLNSTVWDEWADADGSIGKAYGYQLGVKHQYKEGMMDQVDRVIYDLKNNPFSRRIMTNIYVHADLHEMNLYPCAYSMTFNVTHHPGDEKLTLNAILNQRSARADYQGTDRERAASGTEVYPQSGCQRFLPVHDKGYHDRGLRDGTADQKYPDRGVSTNRKA